MARDHAHVVAPLILGRVPVKLAHASGHNSDLSGSSGKRDGEEMRVNDFDGTAVELSCVHLRHLEDVRGRNRTLRAHGGSGVRTGKS